MCLFSIIIVSWNTRDLLAQCLESIHAHPPDCPYEVWVVDNASTDGSAALVRARFPGARLIENTENLGFARANNQAIRQSQGRYVLLLNSDTVVLPNALTILLRFMDEHPEVGLAGGNLLNPDRTPQVCYGNAPGLSSEVLTLLGLDRWLPLLDVLRCSLPRTSEPWEGHQDVDWVLGACMMLRRTALDQVGLLDEQYYMYSEETDWAQRARQKGWRVAYLSAAGILHYGGASTRQVSQRMLPYLYASKTRYLAKHAGRVTAGLYRLAVLTVLVNKGAISFLRDSFRGQPAPAPSQWREIVRQYRSLT